MIYFFLMVCLSLATGLMFVHAIFNVKYVVKLVKLRIDMEKPIVEKINPDLFGH